ncbi:toprim domain-containing protein [Actinomadura xylanilytica]|uniref:toprim domain-containing protein n=1 Tax=Actinomadura xylanilytica TaxID=887459 RepID=UPI00255B111D|nr:toprim domain-containing protein [Actinomadura xylanilytica]MDL4770711.1 toprim domain-containing protein [Actinomadura xylanilytica]
MTTPSAPDEEARQAEERQRRAEILHGISEHELGRLHAGDLPWEQWLASAHRHGHLGFANTLLIGAQRPSATDVRSYEEWKAQGRQVARGETGMRILSRGGMPRPVFDIAQTSRSSQGPAASLTPAQVMKQLHRLAAGLELYVDRDQSWTYTGRPERRIVIPAELDDEQATTLLAHQLAHILRRGDRPDPAGEEPTACHGVRRVRADSIAYLVLAHLGMDTSHLSFPPVQGWAGTDPRANPQAALKTVCEDVLSVAGRTRRHLDTLPSASEPSRAGGEPNVVQLSPGSSDSTSPSVDALLAVHLDAHAFYEEHLPGSWAPSYLAERGFTVDIQALWQLGYAPQDRHSLIDHLRGLGHSDETVIAAGLARRGRDGEPYDVFRDRILFPLRNPDGAVVGFIGRRPDEGPGPKYLNSPETSVFRKSELLFGLYEGRGRLARGSRPIIVEGPLDAIAVDLAAPGNPVAVALCGTAITTAHLDSLARHTDLNTAGVVLALDGDHAGETATLRAWTTLAQVTGPVEVLCLSSDVDLADILHDQGCAGVCEALHLMVPLADLVVDASIERSGGTLEFAEHRLAAVRAATSLIARMRAPQIARQVARVATRTGLDTTTVTAALASAISPDMASDPTTAAEDFPLPPLAGPTLDPAGTRTPHRANQPQQQRRR